MTGVILAGKVPVAKTQTTPGLTDSSYFLKSKYEPGGAFCQLELPK
jgi:hypothetical protein